jgi:hypothetical protein
MTNTNQPRTERRARSDMMARSPRGETRQWQLGPKIRVGGSIGRVGQNIKIATGKALSNPLVDGALALIPGVGPGISAAAGATGRALDTSNGGLHGLSGLASLAAGGATGDVAGRGGNAIRGGIQNIAKNGIGSVVNGGATRSAAGTVAGKMAGAHNTVAADGTVPYNPDDPYGDGNPNGPGPSGGDGFMDYMKKMISGGGKDGQGNLGSLGDVMGGLFGNGGMDKLLMGGGIAAAAADKQRQQGFQDKAADYATGDYDKNAGMRDEGRSLVADRSTPDLSSLYQNSGNPYDRARRGMPMGTAVPVKDQY